MSVAAIVLFITYKYKKDYYTHTHTHTREYACHAV